MSSEHDPRDEALARQVRSALDEHADRLDLKTQMRLEAARRNALTRPATRRATPWVWGSLAAAAGVGVLALSLNLRSSAGPDDALFEEMELLAANEPTELLAEPEFYAWLPEAADAGTGG